MNKRLIIAEKPSVAREIAAALGGFKRTGDWHERHDFLVTSGVGHLVELHADHVASGVFELERLPVVPPSFRIRCIADREKQFGIVQQLIARPDVSGLINACDAGREGELIFRLIVALAGSKKPVERLWLRSMTATAIRQAMDRLEPSIRFDPLGAAALCRTEADWLIGINGSRAVTAAGARERGRTMLSVGRVQSPTLALLVDRELEITNFKPESYWEVHARFLAQAGEYEAKWIDATQAALSAPHSPSQASPAAQTTESTVDENPSLPYRLTTAAAAKAIVERCKDKIATRTEARSDQVNQGAPGLFDLTTLQREANRRLKWSAKQTLDIAQKLYEKKLLTYPRTDCQALPEDYPAELARAFEQLASLPAYRAFAEAIARHQWIRPTKRIFDDSKITDHFAIVPTGRTPDTLDAKEASLFDLVVRRTLAAFYPPARFERVVRSTWIGQDCFRSRGQVLIDAGWTAVYGDPTNGSKGSKEAGAERLVEVSPVERPRATAMTAKALKTKPPARYTEASLLSAMEHAGRQVEDETLRQAMKARGLGTPATRAAIIENLLSGGSRGKREPYVRREGRAQHLVPSALGIQLITELRRLKLEFLTSAELTGDWESRLHDIEAGKLTRPVFMASIGELTREMVNKIRNAGGGDCLSPVTASSPRTSAPDQRREVPAPLGQCPSCHEGLTADGSVLRCGCGFKLWRKVAGRALSDAEVLELLTAGRTGKLQGLTSKAGKPFAAALVLKEDGAVEFHFG